MGGADRVLLVVRWPVGGIRTYLRYVLGSAEFKAYRFTLVAPEQDAASERLLREALAGIDVNYVFCGSDVSALLQAIRRQLRQERFALVHSHGFSAGALSAIPVRWARVPHLMTAHEVFTPPQFSGWRGKLKRLLLGTLFDQIDIVHAVSDDAARNFLQYMPRLRNARVVTIHHGIDTKRFRSPAREALHARLGLPQETFLIGFLGRFMSPKGFRYLIDAIERLSTTVVSRPFAVVAVGGGGFVREDTAVIRDKDLARYFTFMPFADDVAPIIRGLNVVAMPSLWEACGLLAMEALVTGTPIIGTSCVGLREVLEGSPATVVPPRDVDALAHALRTHIETPSSFAAAAAAYADEAAKRFDVTQSARQMAALYIDLVRA